jgi:hypothetical protein
MLPELCTTSIEANRKLETHKNNTVPFATVPFAILSLTLATHFITVSFSTQHGQDKHPGI